VERMNLTINEVARLAQVSKGTVSKVLNNYKGIADSTRERVMTVVREMGYEPNSSAKALAMRRTGIIGVLIPHAPERSLNGAFWPSIVNAVAAGAVESGFEVSLLLPKREGELEELFTSIVRKKSLDGLILGADMLDKRYIATLIYAGIPFVTIGRSEEFRHVHVDIDSEGAARDITRYLLARGYSRPALIAGPAQMRANAERARGFAEACPTAALGLLRHIPFDDEGAMDGAVEAALAAGADSLVVGAGGDFMMDALASLSRRGKRPPEFAVATFDDYRFLDFMQPRMTAVRQPVEKMGAEAVRILGALLKAVAQAGSQTGTPGSAQEIESVVLPCKIIPRESCGEGIGEAR
jgi:LacI family transcriptional regulator